jgi:hypothetical protein
LGFNKIVMADHIIKYQNLSPFVHMYWYYVNEIEVNFDQFWKFVINFITFVPNGDLEIIISLLSTCSNVVRLYFLEIFTITTLNPIHCGQRLVHIVLASDGRKVCVCDITCECCWFILWGYGHMITVEALRNCFRWS